MESLVSWLKVRWIPISLLIVHSLITIPFSRESLAAGDMTAWVVVLGPLVAVFAVALYLYWSRSERVNPIALRWLLCSGPLALVVGTLPLHEYAITRAYLLIAAFIVVVEYFKPERITARING